MVGAAQALVLKGKYDPDQHWLPFMIGTVFEADEPREPTAAQMKTAANLRKVRQAEFDRRRASPYADVPEKCRIMHWVRDARQGLLPFDGHWKIPNREFQIFQQDGLKGFERTAAGKICTFSFNPQDRRAIEAWCEMNSSGVYNITSKVATFSREIDAVAAKLAFYEG